MHLTSVLLPAPFSPSERVDATRAPAAATRPPAPCSEPKRLEMLDAPPAPAVAASADRARAASVDRRRLMAAPPGARAEVDTAPNTPLCIFTIFIAAAWLPGSVAPQQSSSSRHSKPRSFASRIVVCTQTSVVMPVRTGCDPALAQDQVEVGRAERALAGLVDDRLAGQRRQLRDDVPARLAADQDPAARPRVADADAPFPCVRRERQRLLAGRSARSGRCPSRVCMMWKPPARIAAEHRADRLDAGARSAQMS